MSPEDETYFQREQRRMVEEQLRDRDIRDPRVLEAMAIVPRHQFVPDEHRVLAYADGPLPIGEGQTISQPYIVAKMTQMLSLQGGEKVLEVGTGSGYQAAVLGYLAHEVHSVERHAELAEIAVHKLHRLGYDNVFVHIGDGTLGWAQEAPYDAIIVTAAAPRAPRPLLDQMADGGRMVIPVGGVGSQSLELWERHGLDFIYKSVAPVAFVPLLGEHGWDEEKRW